MLPRILSRRWIHTTRYLFNDVKNVAKFQEELSLDDKLMKLLMERNFVAVKIKTEPAFLYACKHFQSQLDLTNENLVSIINTGITISEHMGDPKYQNRLLVFKNRLGFTSTQLSSLMSNTFADRVQYDSFLELLESIKDEYKISASQLSTLLGRSCFVRRIEQKSYQNTLRDVSKRFGLLSSELVSFMGSAVSAQLEEPGFIESIIAFENEFGLTRKQLISVMNNAVASRIREDSFLDAVRSLVKEYALMPSEIVTILHDGMASRIQNPHFIHAITTFCKEFNIYDIKRVLKGPICTRIFDEDFIDLVKDAQKILDLDGVQLVRLLNHYSVVSNLHDSIKKLKGAKDYFNLSSEQLLIVMSDSFCSRLLNDEEFLKQIDLFLEKVGVEENEKFRILSSETVIARIDDSKFISAIAEFAERMQLNPGQLASILSRGIAPQLTDDGYLEAVYSVKNAFNLDNLQLISFLSSSVSYRITDPTFIVALLRFRYELSITDPALFTKFINNAIAVRVQDKNFIDTIVKFQKSLKLTIEELASLSTGSLMSRIMDPGFLPAILNFQTKLKLDREQILFVLLDGSVASRITDLAFLNVVCKFQKMFDFDNNALIKALVGSVASRIMRPEYIESIKTFQERFQLTNKMIGTLLYINSFGCRVEQSKFHDGVEEFQQKLGLSTVLLVRFLSIRNVSRAISGYPKFSEHLMQSVKITNIDHSSLATFLGTGVTLKIATEKPDKIVERIIEFQNRKKRSSSKYSYWCK